MCGVSSDQEIDEIHDWVTTMYRRDQATFGTNVISMDVEDVKTTYYDTLRMAGKVLFSGLGRRLIYYMDMGRMDGNKSLEK